MGRLAMPEAPKAPITVILLALGLLTTTLVGTALVGTADHGPHEGDAVVTSPVDGAEIAITICKPGQASPTSPAPVVLHGHGWSGSRSTDCSSFGDWLSFGFGVVSIDQRGHGDSGGQAHVMDPDYEGQDLKAVVDHIAGIPWVEKDAPGDPKLGAIGGSYGGGYQFALALTETAETGDTRLDALAPEITWYDLPQSLWPNGVVRSAWVDLLYAAGTASVDMHQGIHEAYWYGLATGQVSDGTVPGVHDIQADFRENSPVGFVEDEQIHLDVPVLLRQGITDNLFPLNQAYHNFVDTLTPAARAHSSLIGYNGGHALPNVLPPGTPASGDPCSPPGGFDEVVRTFFDLAFRDQPTRVTAAPYLLATTDGTCLALDSLEPDTTYEIGPVEVAATPTGAGAPQYIPIAEGPLTVAGIPRFTAQATAAGLDARAFLGLAVGDHPANATVVNNNLYPVRTFLPGIEQPVETELAGLAVELEPGETLYLVVTPVSDMFAHHGSRTPGGLVFMDVGVHLPVVE